VLVNKWWFCDLSGKFRGMKTALLSAAASGFEVRSQGNVY